MKETPQQYTQRILSYIEGKEPLAVQTVTAERLAQLIEGVSTSELRRRPAPDKWSVSEIIAHLADGEIVGGFRVRFILGSPGSPVVAYDQDKWVTSGHYDKRDPQKSVELFRVLREANLALLESPSLSRGSSTGCIPNAARNRSNILCVCLPGTTSITSSK